MRWVKWTKYSIKSECGAFSISRAVVQGKDKFTVWRLPNQSLGYFDSPEEAKQFAESQQK